MGAEAFSTGFLQVVGEREISGVLRVTEQTSSLTPKNREDNLIWFSRDVPALAKKLRTLPILFDLDLASSQEAAQLGGPVGGQTRISLTNDHAQYSSLGGGSVLSQQFSGFRNLCFKIRVKYLSALSEL